MTGKITVVINTLNEEKNVERAIKSVLWADEILVCDMHSDDDTALIAKKLGAVVIFHKKTGFVEPARNFAISKASHEWILILDADEVIPDSLEGKLKEITNNPGVTTFIEIPRKNIIFNKWMKASQWWPDYNIRFFKKDKVVWGNKIHRPPKTEGQGVRLPSDERWAIVHYNYSSISQFVFRMNRYTEVQARELKQGGYEFNLKDLISKPLSEFLGRFFANKGFQDGLHGFSLSLLQAFSELLVYLKLWEMKGFTEQDINLKELKVVSDEASKEIEYWFKYGSLSKNPLKNFLQRAKNKLT
jgi:glycosyltransferase involved in cell wall biosynthesis